MRGRTSVLVGGWSLILGAVAFMAVFSYLAARFDYPAVLDGAAATALQCTLVSALGMMLGLMRWPTIHWRLAELYTTADGA